MADKRTTIPRREFLTWVAKGTSFVLGGLFGCATAITYRGTVVDGRIAMARSELEQLGASDKPVVVRTPDLPALVILIPIDAENFRAVSAECTHLVHSLGAASMISRLSLNSAEVQVSADTLRCTSGSSEQKASTKRSRLKRSGSIFSPIPPLQIAYGSLPNWNFRKGAKRSRLRSTLSTLKSTRC